jgi:predicted RNA-binding Zn ribbon-like protein
VKKIRPHSLLIGGLLTGEPLAVDLANTLVVHEDGDAVDFLVAPGGLSDWLELESERLEGWAPVTESDLSEFRALRAAVREMFEALLSGSAPPEGGVRKLNTASARGPTYLELDDSGAEPRVRTRSVTPASSASSLAAVARSTIDLAGGPARDLLRVCGAPGCPRLFVATNLRRRWCSEPCGNRARVARHYERHRASRK